MKYKSGTVDEIRVAMPSGHTVILGNEWIELPEVYHKAVLAAGCISEEMVVDKSLRMKVASGALDAMAETAQMKEQVRSVIQAAIDNNEYNAFAKNGSPKGNYINGKLGFQVESHIREQVWTEMLEEGVMTPVKPVNTDEVI